MAKSAKAKLPRAQRNDGYGKQVPRGQVAGGGKPSAADSSERFPFFPSARTETD